MRLARLPDPVPPARHEIAASYIGRLATLHGLDINAVWLRVTDREASGGMRRVVVPERLAALTGRTVHTLAGALPELPQPDWTMFRHQPQPGCHHCDTQHPGGKVTRLLPHHRYVCTRYGVWIGPPDADQPTVSLIDLPEIAEAQYRHLRILHRHGWAVTYDALLTAFTFCGHIGTDGEPMTNPNRVEHTWAERAHFLIPPETTKSYSTSRLFAAVYPEAISVAALLASPYWRRHRPLGRHRRLAPSLQPLVTYKPGRTHGRLPDRHRGREQRHGKSALWFSRTRRNAGRNLLFHNHVTAVLTRAWTPAYEKFEGVIWHSARVDEQMKTDTARERQQAHAGSGSQFQPHLQASGDPSTLPHP